jgi:hypothetical protein
VLLGYKSEQDCRYNRKETSGLVLIQCPPYLHANTELSDHYLFTQGISPDDKTDEFHEKVTALAKRLYPNTPVNYFSCP